MGVVVGVVEKMMDERKAEVVPQVYFVKEVSLENLQESQENNCARVSSLIKLWGEDCNVI